MVVYIRPNFPRIEIFLFKVSDLYNKGDKTVMSEGSDNREDLYLESYAFTTAAAIVGSVDRKMFVLMRDGRNLFGILRTFDQFGMLY